MTSATFTTEFRHEFEVERERLLRRRFLWYSGVLIVFNALNLVATLIAYVFVSDRFGTNSTAWAMVIVALQVLLFIGAFIHVYKHLLPREPLLRLVSSLIIAYGASTLITNPFLIGGQAEEQAAMQLAAREARAAREQAAAGPGLADEAAAFDDAGGSTEPSREQVVIETPGMKFSIDEDGAALLDPAQRAKNVGRMVVLGGSLGTIFVSHFFACLFLPWTPRESLRPIIPLLILNALITLWYIRLVPTGGTLSILLSPLVAVPGMAICVWRNSRIRERFNIRMLKGRYGEIKQELASARQIHESLFPQPITTGLVRFEYRYEPMRQIGGDYLFVQQMQLPGKPHPIMHMAIVDVTGHGIGAALTVNRLYGEIARRFGENPNASPGEILTGLNDYLHHSLATHSVYATAVCLRFDPNAGSLAWASAGHPPAFLRTVDGKIDRLDSTTLVLGACRGDDFHHNEQATRFHPGDMLLLYTDGAIETRNAQGRMLGLKGLEGLMSSVHPDETGGYASAILRGVDEHRFGPAQDDTLIVEVWRPLEVG